MSRRKKHHGKGHSSRKPPGSAPGTLAIDPEAPHPKMRLMAFGPEGYVEREIEDPEEARTEFERWPVTWVNVDGLGDEATLRRLAEIFGIHRLALEDVVSLGQRAKVEPYQDYLFVVGRMPAGEPGETEQLSLFLGAHFVLTFQERSGDCFEAVRERIRHGKGLLRGAGSGYLTYALLDSLIDGYFPVLEAVSETLEAIEDEVLGEPEAATISRIHAIKRSLVSMRRAIWPHREAINALSRDAGDFVSEETVVHLRDCYDHTVQIVELVEAYREAASDLMGTYLSAVSNRMNEVMKVLTIIATIFIPLSFIAGLYGMNFDREVSPWNMPELGWYFGYPFALGGMAAIGVGMVVYFWRRGWFR